MKTCECLFIGGDWVASSGDDTLEVTDAATEEVIASIPAGTAVDVDRAVAAARAAFPSWSKTSVEDRATLLQNVASGLTARTDEIATAISREVGTPFEMSRQAQAGMPILDFSTLAQVILEFPWRETIANTVVVREPVGTVGAITPWNYPLHQICAKVAPALAAGCTIVVKPSEIAPLTAFVLADVLDEVGLPPGVFNLVTGVGPVVGEAIAAHPDVDMVSFTGSTAAGKRVMHLATETVKRVALELGGKSANVVLDDADLEVVIPRAVVDAFRNAGQNCSALTRLLVPRSRLARVNELARSTADAQVVGNPFEPDTEVGPLISSTQRDRVRSYIRAGMSEGATLLAGGPDAPSNLPQGYFVRPTVFTDVDSSMTIAQEEIFGPVLSILPYDTEDDAVRIANDTVYGLSGAVWSADAERAERVAHRLRTGRVSINGGPMSQLAPFGGYKQSGLGREFGRFGLEEYLESKALQRSA